MALVCVVVVVLLLVLLAVWRAGGAEGPQDAPSATRVCAGEQLTWEVSWEALRRDSLQLHDQRCKPRSRSYPSASGSALGALHRFDWGCTIKP